MENFISLMKGFNCCWNDIKERDSVEDRSTLIEIDRAMLATNWNEIFLAAFFIVAKIKSDQQSFLFM